MRELILAPSILAADFTILGQQIQDTQKGGAKYLHFDAMDGAFVPSISFGAPVLQSIKGCSDLYVDAHLMIEEPIRYVETFVKAGADLITIHIEACKDVKATIEAIKECGAKVGLSIKPKTAVADIIPYLEMLDMVLVMSVEPGFGGQSFMPESVDRIKEVKALIDERNLDIDIQVDGGISADNVALVRDAGANIFVAGSAVFKGNIVEQTKAFVEAMNK